MNKRLAKLMLMLTALVMVLLPIMTQAESCYLCDRIPLNEASRQPTDPYLFYLNDEEVYAGDKVNLEHFELWCAGDMVDPADYTLAGAGNGEVYDTFGDVTVKAICAQHNRVLHTCTVNVLPNELDIAVRPMVEANKAFAAETFVTGVQYTKGELAGTDAVFAATAQSVIEAAGQYKVTVAADYAKNVDVDVRVWNKLVIANEPAEGEGVKLITVGDKNVYVLSENEYQYEISGEPNQEIYVTVNGGEAEIVKLDAEGKAVRTLKAAMTGTLEERIQTLEVAYVYDFSYVEGGLVEDITHAYFDGTEVKIDDNSFGVMGTVDGADAVVDTVDNRQDALAVKLPEPGYVSSVDVKWADGTTENLVSVAAAAGLDDYSAAENHVKQIKLPYAKLVDKPEGATYTITFTDMIGNTAEYVVVTDRAEEALTVTVTPGVNENNRLKGVIQVNLEGLCGESVKVTLSWVDDEGQVVVLTKDVDPERTENGNNAEIILKSEQIPRNATLTVSAEYVNIDGAADTSFIFDDVCSKPIILTPVFENAYVIAGVVEVGSIVKISYPQYEELGYMWVYPDAYGFFCAELDMLEVGDQVLVDVFDLGDNASNVLLTAVAEDEVPAQNAHVMGKLFTDAQNEEQPWMNITKVRVSDLKAGVTYPILADNCFEIGEFTATMDENGKVVFDYTIDDSIAEVVDSYMTVVNSADFDGLAARSYKAAAEDGIVANANTKDLWIYAEFIVNLDVDGMVETFQMESLRDSELKQQYIKLQQN